MRKYLKINGERLDLTDDGVQLNGDVLELHIVNNNGYQFTDFTDKYFATFNPITVYSCNVQYRAISETEGHEEETDEYVHQYFDKTTKLVSIKYDIPHGVFVLEFIEPDEIEERISELEDAMNYILIGGE